MKKNHWRSWVLCGVFCGTSVLAAPLKGQSADNTTWTTVSLKHKFDRKLDLSANVEWRTKDDVSETDRWGFKVGAGYKVLPFLKLGAGYEIHYRNRGADGWKHRHRYMVEGTLSARWLDWKLSLRERFQHTFDRHDDEVILRSRLKMAYDIPSCKLEPYASVEMYNGLNKGECFDVMRMRYRGGLSFPVFSLMDVEVFYCRQWEEKKDKNIFGVELSFEF